MTHYKESYYYCEVSFRGPIIGVGSILIQITGKSCNITLCYFNYFRLILKGNRHGKKIFFILHFSVALYP